MRAIAALVCALLLVVVAPCPVHAHPIEFGALRVAEGEGGEVEVTFRFSGTESAPDGVSAVLRGCRSLGAPLESREGVGLFRRERVDCGERGLSGVTLALDGLEGRDEQVVVRVERATGEVLSDVLDGRRTTLDVRVSEGAFGVGARYVRLGAEHIAEGIDHILFVLALVLAGRRPRAIALTVTAFTLGHSATLALSALELVELRPAPVEALIAASIVLVARELVVSDEASSSLTRRRPWLVAAMFGLFHGLGFAGALRDVGLPAHARFVALVGFNVGVELGQLVFVALVVVLLSRMARFAGLDARVRRAVPYAIGAVASYWLLARTLAVLA